MMVRFRCARILALLLLITSAHNVAGQGDTLNWDDNWPVGKAWLRDRLPNDTLVYLRVPDLLGVFGMPKGNALDPALRNDANIENIRRLQKGISENLLPLLPVFDDPRVRTLQEQINSPIEIAAFMSPAPSAIVSLRLRLESNEAFEAMIHEFAISDPGTTLAAPLDENGVGQLMMSGMPAMLQFDADSGHLIINSGPAVSADSFALTLASLQQENEHPMKAMEASIDESGQGFLAWINAEQALPALQMFAQPEQIARFTALGLGQVNSVAIGYGVANGKARLAVVANVPAENNRELLPYVNNELDARSVGEPDAFGLFSIPTAEEFRRIEALALASAGEESQIDWQQGKSEFADWSGVQIEEILTALGPEVMGIFDAAGDYAAIRLRDEALWNDIVARISEKTGNAPESRRVGRRTYYHWNLPSDMGFGDANAEANEFDPLIERLRDHYYWTIDDGYLYVASVPQVLIDRADMRPRQDIGEWLATSQRIDGRNALLTFTGTSRKLPGRLYTIYIELLQILADLAETEIDVWSMPTVRQLGLPDKGAVGFTVKLGNPNVSMELMFENNPLEVFGAGGTAIFVTGIAAAVAIPAYQDYTVRAKVAEGVMLATPTKAAVTEHFLITGEFPGQSDAAAMSIFEEAGEHVWSVVVQPGTGTIVVTYMDDVIPDGGQLFMEPGVDANGNVSWTCSATIEGKLLPSNCRGNAPPVYETDGV